MYQKIANVYRDNEWTWIVSGNEVYPTAEDIEFLVTACSNKLRDLNDEVSQIEIGDPGRLIVRKEGGQIYAYILTGRV